ncbi:MAG: DUF6982 domain-containing protein [Acidobacteriaceae bacterium]
MSASRKKAIVRKLSRDWVSGYVSSEDFCHQGTVELLDLSGKVILLPAVEIKWLCFVRDFNSGELNNPERLLRKTFASRPRIEGVFLRLRLSDGEQLEGIATNDRSLIDGDGLFLLPPDTRSNTQRLWIPATTIAELEAVAVITSHARHKESPAAPRPAASDSSDQPDLFP